jgi:pimeloyl-ACP methyl ester carboxylesterase
MRRAVDRRWSTLHSYGLDEIVLAGDELRGKDSAERLSGRSRRRPFYLVLLAVLIGLLVSYWSWLDAQARAVMVISSVLDAPVLTPAAEAVSGEPDIEDIPVAGNPTLVARPAGDGPWPAIFLVNGTVREGRKLPEVRNLAEGFARAGYLVVVSDLPGLTEAEITPETARETVEVAREVSARPDVEGREVALVGVSTGATLALLAAEKASLEKRVSVVAGIAPYSDIRTIVNIATTGHYRRSDGELIRYEADSFLPYVIAHSLVAALPPGEDRRTLSGELASIDREDPDPLSGFRARRTDDLGPGARSVVGLLANRDPERFAALYADLPDNVRHDLEELSPLAGTGKISVPVELATGPHDKYFPPSQSYALERVAPQRRVTVTVALDHAKLDVSLGDIPAFATFDAFVVRSLRTARAGD